LIQETSVLVLEQDIIKRDLAVRYEFSDSEYSAGEDSSKSIPFVCLHGSASYSAENIGNDSVDVPIGIKLPNPIIPEMIECVSVRQIQWRRDLDLAWSMLTPEQLILENDRLRLEMRNSAAISVRVGAPSIKVRPRELLHIRLVYVIAKEVEDTEIVTMATPSDGLRLEISDPGYANRIVRARSLRRKSLEESPDGVGPSSKSYNLSGFVLPQQGAVVWWKKKSVGKLPDRPSKVQE
jgi:hypothetical protein